MNLFRETGALFTWLASILRSFWQVRPGVTFAVISASAAARITNLLAFVLPLKVILLAGSDGVPRYFRFFIDPADKMGWIIGLSIAAVVFYAITLALEALSSRLSLVGGGEVTTGANDMSIIGGQESEAKGYYAMSCQLWANLVFAVLGLAALAFLDARLFLVMAGLIALQYAFSAWAVRKINRHAVSRLTAWVRDNLKNYLKLFSSINFLTGFLVILVPFVINGDGNILVAILSIVIVRQLLGSLLSVVVSSVRLRENQHLIDPLVFREVQVRQKESRDTAAFRQLFRKDIRESRVARELAERIPGAGPVAVEWRDSPLRGLSTFLISIAGESGRRAQLQVFSPKCAHFAEREEFLFRQIPRAELSAPARFAYYMEGEFACQICDFGRASTMAAAEWKAAERELLMKHWSRRPPRPLVEGYAASHPLLHQRLNARLVASMEIAADTGPERKLLAKLLEHFESLADLAGRLPLYVHNPEMLRTTVVRAGEEDEYLVMNWGRWALEPVGARLPAGTGKPGLARLAGRLREAREDVPEDFGPPHLRLAWQLRELERQVSAERYKAAFGIARAVLRNPLVVQHV